MLLEAHEISKHFAATPGLWQRLVGRRVNHSRIVQAVEGVSFDLRAGEIFGLLGQSGSGKTTLARLLLRLIEPTSGRLFFEGRDVLAMTAGELKTHLRSKARLLFQHPDAALNPAFTVAQILDQALKTHTALPPTQRRDRALTLLEEVRLPPPYLRKYPHELSGGEKRRVGISRALATDPLLLIADEPVSGLDVSLQRQILDLLARLRQQRGLTLMLIAHNVGLIHRLCDRIGVMHAGRLVELGPRQAVSPDQCRHPYTRALYDARLTLSPDTTLPLPPPPTPDPMPAPPSSGCPYQPSCARWRHLNEPERCLYERPELTFVGDDHQAACHFAE